MATHDELSPAEVLRTLEQQVRALVGAGQVAAVAFSGGADSAFLLALAGRALGNSRVVAITAVSPSLAAEELAQAQAFAAALGVRHVLPPSDELASPGYAANSPARCFHCKSEVIDVVARSASTACSVEAASVVVMTGTNADDLRSDFRPGIAAARRLGAVTPLAELSKATVRRLSKHLGLTTWDKPAQACLASRIAYGVPVSAAGLQRVQAAEASLRALFADRALAVVNLRVRDLGDDAARVEVDRDLVPRVTRESAVREALQQVGFTSVEVDPLGFRSGSMNELLTVHQ